MKIAIIGSAYPLRGGIAAYVERLAEEFQNQGHEVVIYSFSLQYPSFLFPGATQYSEEPAPKNLTIKTIINSVNPNNWRKVGAILKAEKPDLIFVKYWMSFFAPSLGTIFRIVKRNKHTRIYCIADNITPHEKRFFDTALTKYFLKAINGIVAMSKNVLEDAKRISHLPILYAPHPLYDNYGSPVSRKEALEKLGLSPENKYALFFGFIRKYKGLDLLLEAMADPRIASSNIHLIVAGEYYGDRDFYETIITKNQIQNRVHLFTDFIPSEAVKYYFCAADCIALPYRSATQSGITQIAYHFERGMLATNVGGLPEAVRDGVTGIVCEPNVIALVEGLLKYFDPNSLPNLANNLAEEKKQYSWETFASALLAFAG